VTQTSSVRFGDLAEQGGEPQRSDDVELRPRGPRRARGGPADLRAHAEAFCQFVASAAGLPPVGAVPLAHRTV
jgi:hypothetical protein